MLGRDDSARGERHDTDRRTQFDHPVGWFQQPRHKPKLVFLIVAAKQRAQDLCRPSFQVDGDIEAGKGEHVFGHLATLTRSGKCVYRDPISI